MLLLGCLPTAALAAGSGVPDVSGRYRMLCPLFSSHVECDPSVYNGVYGFDGVAEMDLRTTDFTPAEEGQKAQTTVRGLLDVPYRGFWYGPYDAEQETCFNLMSGYENFNALYDIETTLDWTITPDLVLSDQRGVDAVVTSMVQPYDVWGGMLFTMQARPVDGSTLFQRLSNADLIQGTKYFPCNSAGEVIGALRPRFWTRIGGPPPLGDLKSYLAGRVLSAEQTFTDVPYAVHRFRLTLFRQASRVPEREPGQSLQEYIDLIDEIGGPALLTRNFGPTEFGDFGEKGPGYFRLESLPLFYQAEGGAKSGRLVAALYTIKIEDAETDEFALDDENNPIPGEFTTLPFEDTIRTNVELPAPDSEEDLLEIPIEPLGSIAAKRVLAERLETLCEANYGLIEQLVQNYLDDLEDGTLEFTAPRSDGLERAIWAERAALAGVLLADEIIEVILKGMGRIIGDIYSDFFVRTREDIKEVQGRVKELDALGGLAKPPPGISLGATNGAALASLTASQRALFEKVQMTEFIRDAIKFLKPKIEAEFRERGLSDGEARVYAGLLVSYLEALLNSIAKASISGQTVGFLKLFIAETIDSIRPLLLDAGQASYCGITDETLQLSSSHMQAWMNQDHAAYLADRQLVVNEISTMVAQGSTRLADARWYQEMATGLSRAQDFLGLTERGIKWTAVLKQVARVLKYAFNTVSVVRPFTFAWWDMQGAVERAEEAAFPPGGLPASIRAGAARGSSGESAAVPGIGVAAVAVSAPDETELDGLLGTLAEELVLDEVGNAMEATVGMADPNFVEAVGAWRRGLVRVIAQASAVDPSIATPEYQAALQDLQTLHLEESVAQSEVWGLLGTLFHRVVTGDYEDSEDPEYIEDRARALTAIDTARLRLADTHDAAVQVASLANNKAASPALVIDDSEVTSASTSLAVVTETPESFELRVHVANVSGDEVSNVEAKLTVTSPLGTVSISGSETVTVGSGTLAMDDGTDGSGSDEADVTWTLLYDGDLDWETAVLEVELLEDGAAPTSFLGDSRLESLEVSATVSDLDGDGLPDSFEEEYGLDLGSNDAGGDPDEDDLTNEEELILGTRPDLADTDDDGLEDGEEIRPGEDGFVTDPLDDDSDDDGTEDGPDGAPLDPSSTAPAAPDPEPEVELSKSLVLLTATTPLDAVEVTNGGDGELVWRVTTDNPALVIAEPVDDDLGAPPRPLFIGVPDGFDFGSIDVITTTVVVTDVAGADKDSREILVVLGGDITDKVCGHGSDRSVGGPHTASDALIALSAGVGVATCVECRCDVNDSGSVSASDALAILRRAVGQDVNLTCPSCG